MDHQKSSRHETKVSKMSYRIKDFEDSAAWAGSLGEKLGKIQTSTSDEPQRATAHTKF